eukprot:TRINITY_DN2393_c1_g1_i1.p1 TRINITY_DN2393_c1_g1~~TRINITY_DN2393_c1_g1_i1.p1  ORF type:complete len:393 (-),score=128.11 TRINITY_DN2393_c1_g1_i1:153-1331(-)
MDPYDENAEELSKPDKKIEKKLKKEKEKAEKAKAKEEKKEKKEKKLKESEDKKKKKEEKQEEEDKNAKTYNLVVFDGSMHESHDWKEIFKGFKLEDGSRIKVHQCSWLEAEVSVYDKTCMMMIAPHMRLGQSNPGNPYTIEPHFILMRNQPRGATPESDKRNVLYGLMSANIPASNSLISEYMNLERPVMFGALMDIKNRVGAAKFPLISQSYFSSYHQMVIAGDFPTVIKVSHAHRGMGKIKLQDNEQFRDLATVVALHGDYCTSEPFIECDYGIRVQKVGEHYRAYKKVFTGSGWKSQFGGADLQDIELSEEYKLWAEECGKCFGGMDFLSVDALHGKDGKNYIIELNGTATGFHSRNVKEDSEYVRETVLKKMNAIYSKKEQNIPEPVK